MRKQCLSCPFFISPKEQKERTRIFKQILAYVKVISINKERLKVKEQTELMKEIRLLKRFLPLYMTQNLPDSCVQLNEVNKK